MRKAVIDVGSNSVLLTVEERTTGGWRPIYEATDVTAIGEGTKETKKLSPIGVTKSLAALKTFFKAAKEYGAEDIRAFATMAARIADDTAEFQAKAEAQGTPVGVLSGDDEARLGFLAVAQDPLLNDAQRLSIIDPGGHSTELVTADRLENDWNIRFRRSFPIGTLALRGGPLKAESPNSLDILRACGHVDDIVGLCYRPGQGGRAVVLGATGTNLISIREKYTERQPEKVHGAILDYEEVSRAVGWLSEMTDQERAAVPGMEKGREKTIHLGALILERFLFALREPECRVSIRGWRHALLESE